MDQPTQRNSITAKRFRPQLALDIEHCSPTALRAIILDVRTPAWVLDRIAQSYSHDEDILRDLVRCPNLNELTLAFIALAASDEMRSFIAFTRCVDMVTGDAAGGKTADAGGKKKLSLQQLVVKMSPSQKIKLALTGAKDARGMLIRESSKTISLAVIANPRITIGEIEFFAKSTNLNEDVIRKIGSNAEWTRRSTVVNALVCNPKTPVGISLPFVPRMSDRDLGILEKSRSIPAAVRTAARTTLAKRKLGKG